MKLNKIRGVDVISQAFTETPNPIPIREWCTMVARTWGLKRRFPGTVAEDYTPPGNGHGSIVLEYTSRLVNIHGRLKSEKMVQISSTQHQNHSFVYIHLKEISAGVHYPYAIIGYVDELQCIGWNTNMVEPGSTFADYEIPIMAQPPHDKPCFTETEMFKRLATIMRF